MLTSMKYAYEYVDRDRKFPPPSQPVVSAPIQEVVPPDPAVILPTLPPPPRYEPSVTIKGIASKSSQSTTSVVKHTESEDDDDEFGDFVGT